MNSDKKWVFIINPVAGNGYALSLEGKINEMIVSHHLDAEIVFTTRKGHASELSIHYAGIGYDYIIGVGGDGTINEIASPLILNKKVSIGLIGGGTGNDFLQITGFPGRFEEKDWGEFFKANVQWQNLHERNGIRIRCSGCCRKLQRGRRGKTRGEK